MGLRALATVMTLLLSTAATAQDDGWEFDLGAYAWALSMQGDGEINGRRFDVDVAFSDILDQLNFALMGNFEARHGKIFFAVDAMGSVLEGRSTLGPAKIRTDTTLVSENLFAGYRVLDRSLGGTESKRRVSLDVYTGGRFWYLDSEIELSSPAGGFPTTRASDSTWWIDPEVGLRVEADLTDRLTATLLGDVGGFGIGTASDLSWETVALLGWRINRAWSVQLGYKAIGIDRLSGGTGFDGTLHGPLIAFAYQWGSGHRTPLD